jgi:hypothetical protein
MRGIALEIPLALLGLARLAQCDDSALSRVELVGDGIDRAALARGVAAFEDDDDALPGLGRPAGHRDEFSGHRLQPVFICLALHDTAFRGWSRSKSLRCRSNRRSVTAFTD